VLSKEKLSYFYARFNLYSSAFSFLLSVYEVRAFRAAQ
jgi:hypothetical protein